ncbi:MAG: Heat-inducible transcription repressor HrcA [candidate division WS6 bacterium OLB20]|uniref:Heat-inducible transcription repressor HrcA n=1 Tax=candidate division WS6 bacterium OLB20 TaxID=1617426 RepID=A0A136M0Q5_9BACT|nr:MAG: Heat-inducible transcription repressor HrcA [candidate division WS6 bacterium OLB20]
MTPRQSKLLKAIIDEFIQSAEAVGSVNLASKYRLGVSPATIRNEMAELVKQGYLEKPHSSSGRVPTNMGFKFFIDRLLSDLEELEVKERASIREELFQARFDSDSLIYRALQHLAAQTGNLAVFSMESRAYYNGFSYLISKPDYAGKEELRDIFAVIEDNSLLRKMFNRYRGDKQIRILIGEDTGHGIFSDTTMLFSPVKLHGGKDGYLALVGPNRMNYARNIPLLEFIATNLSQVVSGW